MRIDAYKDKSKSTLSQIVCYYTFSIYPFGQMIKCKEVLH